MIVPGFRSISFGVGAPKRFVLNLSSFHIFFPRHLAWKVKFVLIRIGILMLAVAYPSFVNARHLWPLRFEDQSNTDGWREADKCWSETDNAERC